MCNEFIHVFIINNHYRNVFVIFGTGAEKRLFLPAPFLNRLVLTGKYFGEKSLFVHVLFYFLYLLG